MKKMLLWSMLAMLAVTLVSSCSKDDDDANYELTGTWKMTALEYSGTATTSVAGQSEVADFTGVGSEIDITINFQDDPNEYSSDGSYLLTTTTTTNGQSEETEETIDSFLDNGTWERDGDMITITDADGEVFQATIVTLNGTTLILDVEDNETVTEPLLGLTVEVDAEGTYTFERL